MKLASLFAVAALGFVSHESRAIEPARAEPSASQDADKKEETEAERKLRKAKKLLDVQGTLETQKRAVDKMIGQFTKMGLPEEFGTRFKDRFDLEELMGMTAKIYAEELEEATLDAVIAFYETEQGKTFAAAMPGISEKAVEIGMKYGERIGREVGEEMNKK
jgi:hypothetical protein